MQKLRPHPDPESLPFHKITSGSCALKLGTLWARRLKPSLVGQLAAVSP